MFTASTKAASVHELQPISQLGDANANAIARRVTGST